MAAKKATRKKATATKARKSTTASTKVSRAKTSASVKIKPKTATKIAKTTKPGKSTRPTEVVTVLSHDQIAVQAFKLWKKKGCPEKDDSKIWHEAEKQLIKAAKTR